MVNIPPIPPLLCSTPPPIDFGDDEDVNALPLSLDGVVDDSFGVFQIDDDIKNNVPLPSPQPPSECDLPKISIYDNLVSYDKEHLTSHLGTLPASNDPASNDSRGSREENISEAFNFNLRKTNSVILPDQSRNLPLETEAEKVKVAENLDIANPILDQDSNGCSAFSQPFAPALCKNFKELKINSLNSAPDISCDQNVVSIEDIEDDLSDDELYSPKIPKNFLQIDDMRDFFKIEEINTLNVIGNKSNLYCKNVDAKSLNSLDNSESASFGNEHIDELSSFSGSSLKQNQLNTPPPLQQIENSINNDDDDDFGEFADFQKMQFLNNVVPANDNEIKEHVDLEVNDFNDFTKYNTTEDYVDNNAPQYVNNSNDSEDQDRLKVSAHTDGSIDDTNNNSNVSHMFQMMQEACKQEASNEIMSAVNKNNQSLKAFFNKDDISNEFNTQSAINDTNNWQNFSEFSNTTDIRNTSETAENVEQVTESSVGNLEDEFDDFADFKSQEINEANIKSSSYNEGKDNTVEHYDDDFGEFNTAEPVTIIASNTTFAKTGPNSNPGNPLPFNNINERILKILKLMFPSIIHPEDKLCCEPKPNKIQDIPFTSIDTAKALEYQWLSSETRHSFIKSLSIDSKNILFGDNWNPSLPRFAANLSFNPLKPMKPLQSSGGTLDVGSVLEPVPSSRSEINNALHISVTTKKELDLDWKSVTTIEQPLNAFKEETFNVISTGSTSLPHISNESMAKEPESLTILENVLDIEETLSKTPPISEMETVRTYSSTLPVPSVDMQLPISQIALEDNVKHTVSVNEVIATSTFTGSFKETHIYTPPQANDFESKCANSLPSISSASPTKASPIDFDYEKAAMGVIIDETVVKKEYRDVEYNSPFSMEPLSKSSICKTDMFETSSYVSTNPNTLSSAEINIVADDDEASNDDFSEFQSVSSDIAIIEAAAIPKNNKPLDGMILSPAILIPQAISMESQKPKIEWGDSTANINPDELARIEELFPEPRSLKSSNTSTSSQKSTPTHQIVSTPSISATVANKEFENNVKRITDDDDDDWSDFVSVTVGNNCSAHKAGYNNNILGKSPAGSPFQQRSHNAHKMPQSSCKDSNNDDEWSEFVSSAPPLQQPNAFRVPQFNSGAWQNANFYNNPLSMYHKGPLNMATTNATNPSPQKYMSNNNNNSNISQQPYQIANNVALVVAPNNHQTPNNAYQQQIHVMQNFSTEPTSTPERLSAAPSVAKNNQFQSIGSAKIAPSIALIPDLGFVAPAIPTHTSFINSLPKPSINMKK